MAESKLKIRIIRILWGVIPWMMVVAIGAFIMTMGKYLVVESGRLAEAKNAAMKKEVPAVRVITLTMSAYRMEDKISLPGEVKAFEDLWVKSEAKGQVVSVAVEEGQRIKKGQLLVKLDDRDYRSRIERIEANYKLAKLDHDRILSLAKRNASSQSKLDAAVALLTELKAQYSEAKLHLDRTRIIAPIDGVINELVAKLGDFLDENFKVAQILQIDPVKIAVGVPESDVAAIYDLKFADVVIEALDNKTVRGERVFLGWQPRSLARLYDLELTIENPDRRILPGMFAQVELVKKVYDNALTIPLYAVITQGDERFVYIEKDGKALKRPVMLGVLVNWQVHIKSGIHPGDRVIVVGHRFLDDGQAVDVIKNVSRPDEIFAS
jgi:RND family efflux transporter MFP subunit